MGAKTTTKLSFQVTLQLPEGRTIKETREAILAILKSDPILNIPRDGELKIHLLNKETSYGKR